MGIFSKKKVEKQENPKKKVMSSSGQKIQAINLIPPPTKEEVEVVATKGKRNLSGVAFIALIVFVAVAILGFNLWTKLRLNTVTQNLAEIKNEIQLHQLVEIQKKTLDNKLAAYQAVKDEDFKADRVLEYLLEVADGLSDVRTLYLDNSLQFEMAGSSTSYSNVARLWHDMTREDDYFKSISLERVSKSLETGKVSFTFSGYVIEDKIDQM